MIGGTTHARAHPSGAPPAPPPPGPGTDRRPNERQLQAMSASAVDTPGAFSHEALFYAGPDDFAGQLAAFVREGVAAGEPVLVMVTADKIELLRSALGADADGVLFVDMAEAGRNPGRIISAWSDFARDHVEAGRRLRGIGETNWGGRG